METAFLSVGSAPSSTHSATGFAVRPRIGCESSGGRIDHMLNGRCRTPARSSGRGPPEQWNATPEEAGGTFPCDALAPSGFIALTRAIDVEASPLLVFRWLCQLRAAPYSYDWIDN